MGTTTTTRRLQTSQNFIEIILTRFLVLLSTVRMSKSAVMILAEGAEEMEAVITIDVLRRGGVTVVVAGLNGSGPVKCSRDVVLVPDMSLEEAIAKGPYDAVVLPGGLKGAEALGASPMVKDLLVKQQSDRKIVGAICAAPAVSLTAHGIGEGKKITCYPALKEKIDSNKYIHVDSKVVVDGELITSQGPGTTFDFGLALAEKLMGKEKAEATAKPMLL